MAGPPLSHVSSSHRLGRADGCVAYHGWPFSERGYSWSIDTLFAWDCLGLFEVGAAAHKEVDVFWRMALNALLKGLPQFFGPAGNNGQVLMWGGSSGQGACHAIWDGGVAQRVRVREALRDEGAEALKP